MAVRARRLLRHRCDSPPSDEAERISGGVIDTYHTQALPVKPGKPVPVDALKAKHAIRESFEAARIYDQLLADFQSTLSRQRVNLALYLGQL